MTNYSNEHETHLPMNYEHRPTPHEVYEKEEATGGIVGSFVFGAIVGSAIGAVAALLLAPKSGREMREEITEQAEELKMKSIELTTIARDKATEITSVAKETAEDLTNKLKPTEVVVPTDEGSVSDEDETLQRP